MSSKTPSKATPKKETTREGFNANDVICGTSGNYLNHGNVVFKELVIECIPVFYEKDTTKEDKELLMENILDSIGTLGGRFMDVKTQKPLSRKEAMIKIKNKIQKERGKLTKKNNGLLPVTPARVVKKTPSKTPSKRGPGNSNKDPATGKFVSKSGTYTPKKTPARTNKITVAHNRLLKGAMDLDHALSLLDGISFGDDEARNQAAELLLEQLNNEKQQLKDWAKEELMSAMVTRAKELDIIRSAKKSTTEGDYLELCKAWEEDGSTANMNKVYDALYSTFYNTGAESRHASPWIQQKERDYMLQQNLVYLELPKDTPRRPGTIGRDGYVYAVIFNTLNILHNKVKERGKRSHGVWILAPNATKSARKRLSIGGDNSDAESNATPKKKGRRAEPKAAKLGAVKEAEDSDDESIPIAQLKKQSQQDALSAGNSETESEEEEEMTPVKPKVVKKKPAKDTPAKKSAPEPAPVSARATRAARKSARLTLKPQPKEEVPPVPKSVTIVAEEEMPVPTRNAVMGQAEHSPEATVTTTTTSSLVEMPTTVHNEDEWESPRPTNGIRNRFHSQQEQQADYAPLAHEGVQEVADKGGMMDIGNWTDQQKAMAAVAGICLVFVVVRFVV